MTLDGRSAIITGASQGLGHAIARAMVKAHANVLLIARDAGQLESVRSGLHAERPNKSQHVECLTGDVTDPSTAKAACDLARRQFGTVSILVNNAGTYGPMGRLDEVDWTEWVRAMETNCFGPMHFCRAMLPFMRRDRYGKIINISGGGATAPLPRFSAYAASKSAIVRLTETLAYECQDDGIDINAIAPGALNTRMLDQVLAAGPEKVGPSFYARSEQQRDSGGTSPELAAELAVFLASAESDGITGRLLSAVWDDWKTLGSVKRQLAETDVFTLRRIVPEDRRVPWQAA